MSIWFYKTKHFFFIVSGQSGEPQMWKLCQKARWLVEQPSISNALAWALLSPFGEVLSMARWALHIIYCWSFKPRSHTSHFDVKRRPLYRPPLIILSELQFTRRCLHFDPQNPWIPFLTWHRELYRLDEVNPHHSLIAKQENYSQLQPRERNTWGWKTGQREAPLAALTMEKEDCGPRNVNSLSKLEKARPFMKFPENKTANTFIIAQWDYKIINIHCLNL